MSKGRLMVEKLSIPLKLILSVVLNQIKKRKYNNKYIYSMYYKSSVITSKSLYTVAIISDWPPSILTLKLIFK